MTFPTFARDGVGYGRRCVGCGQMWGTRFSCQSQIEQQTERRALHLAEVLALG